MPVRSNNLLNKRELRYFLEINSFVVLFISIVAWLYLREIQAKSLITLFFTIAILTAVLNFLLIVFLSEKPALSCWISIIAFDLVVAIMSMATGGIESRIPYLFVFPVVFAVYFQKVRGGIIQSAIALLLVYVLTQFEYTSSYSGEQLLLFPSPITKNLSYFLVYALVFAFFTAATSYFSNIIRKQERDFLKYRVSSEGILNAVPSGILTLSPENKLVFSNKSAREILREDELTEFLEVVSDEPESRRNEIRIGERILGYSQNALEDGTKTIVFQDLTEVKKLEEERRELEKLAFLGELAANLAHEIRNPIQAINMAMELLISGRASPNDEFLKSVMYDAERLSQVVNKFLHYAKIPEVKVEDVNLYELVNMVFYDIVRMFVDKVTLRNNIPEDYKIQADPVRMEELFSNLFRNSFEAKTKDFIDVDLIQPGEELPLVDGNRYRASVTSVLLRDYGEGMDEEVKMRAKELFFTNRKEGTGFGLSVCERIMKAHGGSLKIFSVKGKGTDIILEFG